MRRLPFTTAALSTLALFLANPVGSQAAGLQHRVNPVTAPGR